MKGAVSSGTVSRPMGEHEGVRRGVLELQAEAAGRVAIPASALFAARAGEGFVWRYDRGSGKVAARMVSLGQVTPTGVEVTGGLARGDLIVAGGVDRLVRTRDGWRIAARLDEAEREITGGQGR